MQVYDTLIIGGGPAGLSAAIYLGRFLRRVLVIDKENSGRWNTHEINHNYFGFPEGISARELRERGLEQAKNYGAEFTHDEVVKIYKEEGIFKAEGGEVHQGRTVILSTGVVDLFPHFTDWQETIGKSLFWCITCDGYETMDKKLLIVGNDDNAACNAMQFLTYTKDITLVTNASPDHVEISNKMRSLLKEHNIEIIEEKIDTFTSENGFVKEAKLENGNNIPTEVVFNQQGAVPHSQLAIQLGLEVDDKGYVITDFEQRTNVPFVYAAGDITKPYAHQIVSAAHEGSMAAQAANYDLYPPEKKC